MRRVRRVDLLVTMPQRQAARLDGGQQFVHAGEKARVRADLGGVVPEESVAQRLEPGMLRQDAEAGADQPPGAGGSVRTQVFERQVRQSARLAQPVERARQVRRGVRERTVEVEEDCLTSSSKGRN